MCEVEDLQAKLPCVQTSAQCTCRSSSTQQARVTLKTLHIKEVRALSGLHLCLEIYPVLVSFLVVERHPRVRHIIHQVVPVPGGHRGFPDLLSRHSKHGSTAKQTGLEALQSPCVRTARLQERIPGGNAVHRPRSERQQGPGSSRRTKLRASFFSWYKTPKRHLSEFFYTQ